MTNYMTLVLDKNTTKQECLGLFGELGGDAALLKIKKAVISPNDEKAFALKREIYEVLQGLKKGENTYKFKDHKATQLKKQVDWLLAQSEQELSVADLRKIALQMENALWKKDDELAAAHAELDGVKYEFGNVLVEAANKARLTAATTKARYRTAADKLRTARNELTASQIQNLVRYGKVSGK